MTAIQAVVICGCVALALSLPLISGGQDRGLASQSTIPNSRVFGARASEAMSFNKDIAPIVFKHCAPCHHPGDVGPFPLLNYADVRKRAKLVSIVTERRIMPPWKPEPGYGEFQGVRRLTDAEIEAIKRWVDEGAIEGQPEDLPPTPVFTEGWRLGEPDLILKMTKPYDVPADSPEFYRCFVVPTGLSEDRFVVGFEDRPSNRRVVHHSILVQDHHQAGRRLESEPGGGYPCMGGFGFETGGYLGFWTAGMMPIHEPPGVATPLGKNSDLVIQIHFRPTGKPEQERSAIGLYFAKLPPARIPADVSVTSYDIDIPPGEKNYKVKSFSYVSADVEALSVFPHAHYLAKAVKATAILPDGSVKPLLWIKEWDFDWQEEYWYAHPVALPQATRLDMEFTYDNSAANPHNPNHPAARVTWGEKTTDEMAEIHFRLVPQEKSSTSARPAIEK